MRWICVVMATCGLGAAVRAQDIHPYTFKFELLRIAQSADPAPGGGLFTSFDIPASGGFLAQTTAGPALFVDVLSGVRAGTYRTLYKIADYNTPIPGGSGTFQRFGAAVRTEGGYPGALFRFRGDGPDNQQGVYAFDTSTGLLSRQADRTTSAPGGALFDSFADSLGATAFVATDASGTSGVYTYSKSTPAPRIVDSLMTPPTGGAYTGQWKLNGRSITAGTTRGTIVYPDPGSLGSLKEWVGPDVRRVHYYFPEVTSLNLTNLIDVAGPYHPQYLAFIAPQPEAPGLKGLFTCRQFWVAPQSWQYVNLAADLPGEPLAIAGNSMPLETPDPLIVLAQSPQGRRSLYAYLGLGYNGLAAPRKLLAEGDLLDGRTVVRLDMGPDAESAMGGYFRATFDDGSTAIYDAYLAAPEPSLATPALLGLTLLLRRLRA